jgi:hypothetical protein
VVFDRKSMHAIRDLKCTKSIVKEFRLESYVSVDIIWNTKQSNWEKGCITIALDTEDDTKELVYGISVDNLRKRIIVSFRGSETFEVWIRNAAISFKRVLNPLVVMNQKRLLCIKHPVHIFQ